VATIALDFLLGPDLSSQAIAWWGQGPNGWSHVANVLADGRYLDARSDRLGGVPPGVHIRDPQTEAWVRRRRVSLQVSDFEYSEWEANLRAKIGDHYAVWDIVGFFLDKMLHRPATYDCCALAINALQHIKKVPFPLVIPAHQTTPDVLLLIVQTTGFQIGEIEHNA